MYRTFLTRELAAIARGKYSREVLRVPTTLLVGERDLITKRIPAGPAPGQPELRVVKVGGVGHWIPEQRPSAVIEWL
jgi:pimeloyl-ACP methyl ester carboxylesterase